jgi:histidyl-tRNA synthetase
MAELQRRGIHVEMDYEGKSLKSQLRRADKLRARFVLILGEDELARQLAPLRDMDASTQEEVALSALSTLLPERLARI